MEKELLAPCGTYCGSCAYYTKPKKGLLIAQDVEHIKDTLSGENANSMHVPRNMKLNIVGDVMNFPASYS